MRCQSAPDCTWDDRRTPQKATEWWRRTGRGCSLAQKRCLSPTALEHCVTAPGGSGVRRSAFGVRRCPVTHCAMSSFSSSTPSLLEPPSTPRWCALRFSRWWRTASSSARERFASFSAFAFALSVLNNGAHAIVNVVFKSVAARGRSRSTLSTAFPGPGPVFRHNSRLSKEASCTKTREGARAGVCVSVCVCAMTEVDGTPAQPQPARARGTTALRCCFNGAQSCHAGVLGVAI